MTNGRDHHRFQQRQPLRQNIGFVRAIGLFDGTMIVVGSMIGSGIFIVAADIIAADRFVWRLAAHLDHHRAC